MITELHFFAGGLLLLCLLMSNLIGSAIAAMAYPNAGAPILPDGPLRRLIIYDIAFLAVCGILFLLGV